MRGNMNIKKLTHVEKFNITLMVFFMGFHKNLRSLEGEWGVGRGM
jgi:hypothetical protein